MNPIIFSQFSVCLRLQTAHVLIAAAALRVLLSLERERRRRSDTSHRVPAGEDGGGSDTQLWVKIICLVFELHRVALPTLN